MIKGLKANYSHKYYGVDYEFGLIYFILNGRIRYIDTLVGGFK